MKTDNLIHALAADMPAGTHSPASHLAIAAAIGVAVSAALFALLIGPRPDLAAALTSPAFMLKPVEMVLLAAASAVIVLRLAQPGASARGAVLVSAAVPAIMIAALAVELMVVPQSQWMLRLSGVHWHICLLNMVLLGLPVLAAILFGLRQGAPTRPALAGAGAGLLSGALSATLYISHCPDDSPLFVAVWFSLAIAIVTAVGGLVGSRVLRW